MTKVITFTSMFNVGDIVTYDDKITKTFTSTIIDIKFTDTYLYMYKLDLHGIWYTDRYLRNDSKG